MVGPPINTFEGDAFGIKVSLICSDLALAPASCLLPAACPEQGRRAFRLLSHFIRPREHFRRNRQPDLFRRLEVDNEFKLRCLLDRKIAGLSAF